MTAIQGPAASITLYRFQVVEMASETAGGGGIPAFMIDEVLPLPGDGTDMSAVIGAWAASDASFGSRVARLLASRDPGDAAGESDPAGISYPMLALTLLVADITAGSRPTAAFQPRARFASVRVAGAAAEPCDRFVKAWLVNDALVAIIGTLPGGSSNPRLQAIMDILARRGLDYAAGGEALRREILQDLIAIAIILDIRSSIRHWRTSVEAEPPGPRHYAVRGGAPEPGKVKVFVEAPLGERRGTPDGECLASLGLELPRDDAVGSAIDWRIDGVPQLPVVTRQDDTVPDVQAPGGGRVHVATLEYLMPNESAAAHAGGDGPDHHLRAIGDDALWRTFETDIIAVKGDAFAGVQYIRSPDFGATRPGSVIATDLLKLLLTRNLRADVRRTSRRSARRRRS